MNNSTKYLSGYIRLSSDKSYLNIQSFVEKNLQTLNASPLFWIQIHWYKGKEAGRNETVAFNAVEMRAFSNALIRLAHENTYSFSKKTGGNVARKETTVRYIGEYDEICIHSKDSDFKILIAHSEIEALGQEIELLVSECSKNCFKTQQFIERKRGEADAKRKH